MSIWYIHRNGQPAPNQFDYVGTAPPPDSSLSPLEQLDDTSNAEIQAWLAAKAVPQQVTNAQLKRQLNAMGQLTAAQSAVNSAGGLPLELWYSAAVFLRGDPLVAEIGQALGLTSAQIDATFASAAQL